MEYPPPHLPELADLELQAEGLLEDGSGAFSLLLDGEPLTNAAASEKIEALVGAGVRHVVLWLVPAQGPALLRFKRTPPKPRATGRRCWRPPATGACTLRDKDAGRWSDREDEGGGSASYQGRSEGVNDIGSRAVTAVERIERVGISDQNERWTVRPCDSWLSSFGGAAAATTSDQRGGVQNGVTELGRCWYDATGAPSSLPIAFAEGSQRRRATGFERGDGARDWNEDRRFWRPEGSNSERSLSRHRGRSTNRWATGSDGERHLDAAFFWRDKSSDSETVCHPWQNVDSSAWPGQRMAEWCNHSAWRNGVLRGASLERKSSRGRSQSSAGSERDTISRMSRSRSWGRDSVLLAVTTLPSPEDRQFMRHVNSLASAALAPGFGHTGGNNPSLARRCLAFAKLAQHAMPELGTLEMVLGGEAIKPDCEFWRAGRARYLAALSKYIGVLSSVETDEELRRSLLEDLGFYVADEFLTPEEEQELLAYWRPGGPVYAWGAYEFGTKRRFFHYGPILKLKTDLSTKSTLGVIPGKCGMLPPIIIRMGLRQRIRVHIVDRGVKTRAWDDPLDQLYVNHYAAKLCSGIDFHHDNPRSMLETVAVLSLGSQGDLQLLALDRELGPRRPITAPVPPRSLYLLTGLARYHLQHGMATPIADRVSLTMRTVNKAIADDALWFRDWGAISQREASNAHWPLLEPAPDRISRPSSIFYHD